MITSVNDFVMCCANASNSEIFDMFEYDCTDDVRDSIYALADDNAVEPFRSAMHKLGFSNF